MVEMKLELVPIPVSDVDKSKAFYEKVGFGNVHDTQINENMRVVQLTPPGSECAIVFGTGMDEINDMKPGSIKGLHLVVKDMDESRGDLIKRGIEVGGVMNMGGVKYTRFTDPDGNVWLLQQWPESYKTV
ncbi:MAG TPA: VOC family protein [Candidatus Saccharimonadales bacterium]|nr:VOC family protein [Candidatus Saccharimonadales bacterium]